MHSRRHLVRTDDAVALGAFGAPTLIVKKTPDAAPLMFFGSDRFHLIFQALGVAAGSGGPKQYGQIKAKL